ncbi:MAG: aspartate kinase, partial [Holophagales bacterium]|nr:aspartate kinase [Holophagales bacterium]
MNRPDSENRACEPVPCPGGTLQVLKFGGTSVARPDRLDQLAAIVLRARNKGPVLVVVSALAGVTHGLLEALERAVRGEPTPGLGRRLLHRHLEDPSARLGEERRQLLESELAPRLRELDQLLDGVALLGEVPRGVRHRVLALGERLAAPRVAAWLRASELDATVVDGTEVVRVRDDGAEPEVAIRATRHRVVEGLGGLFRGEIPVVTGFVGADIGGGTVTLGRGASDLSATVLAAALDADRVEIWTDTDGVYSADPRRVPSAHPLRQLGYAETAALARYGAKVLHPHTLQPVARTGIPVHVRSTL